jgi:putative DNA primase/helicase
MKDTTNIEVKLKEIPKELTILNQWVAWREFKTNNKTKKIPINPNSGQTAKVNDPSTWGCYEDAVKCYQNGDFNGIGFVFTKNDPFVGIDFDDCFIDETLFPETEKLIKQIGSYTEISPSGQGLHTFIKGKLPGGGIREGKIEIYDTKRFFTVTGDKLPGTPINIKDGDEIIDSLLEQYFPRTKKINNDRAILEKAFNSKNGKKFKSLWEGHYQGYGYSSQSEADLALCKLLAFHFDNNSLTIDKMFRKSGLFRKKWDKVHSSSGKTYGEMTIEKSLNPLNNSQTKKIDNKTFHCSDLGNAERLAHNYGDILGYCHIWKKWLIWDGTKWSEDETGQVKQIAKKTVRKIYDEARQSEDDNKRQTIGRHALSSESNGRIKAMVSLAQSELPVRSDNFDQNKFLLNCKNGTLDLKTGTLFPHEKDNFITKVAPVNYDKTATCPQWEKFLARIMDNNKDLIKFLQRAVGYSLTGDVGEQCLFFFWGSGSNGKSTFLRTIGTLMGDYSQHTATETLLIKKKGAIPNDIARMKGARFVSASESESEHKLAENLIKQMTGDDIISARFLHQEWFEFEPEYKIFLGTNNKPIIKGNDYAIWRRIRLVPFNISIPPEEEDHNLLQKLKHESSGILNWAIEGCLKWQLSGLGTPAEVTDATNEYRKEMDLLINFIRECCTEGPELKVTSKNLYSTYSKWCEDNGEIQLKQNWFGRKLREKGFDSKLSGKKRARHWIGLDLVDQALMS